MVLIADALLNYDPNGPAESLRGCPHPEEDAMRIRLTWNEIVTVDP